MKDTTNKRSAGMATLKSLGRIKSVIAIVVILIVMLFVNRQLFSTYNILNILKTVSIEAIIAFGMTIVIISGGVDLSVGATMSLSGIVAIKMMQTFPVWISIVCALLVGILIGFINGFLAVQQRAEAFVITLGMGVLLTGVCLQLTNAHPIVGNVPAFMEFGSARIFGIPVQILFMVLMLIFVHLLLKRTQFGRNCYAIGGNYEVAKYSGINVIRTKWIAFVLCSFLSALAGVLLSAKLNTGNSTFGESTALVVCCGVVVGGTSFSGGVGNVFLSALGMLLFTILNSAMSMAGINAYTQKVITGIIIVTVVATDCYSRKKKREFV